MAGPLRYSRQTSRHPYRRTCPPRRS
jgi:hypothetical protein